MHLEEKRLGGEILYKGRIVTLEKDSVLLENKKISTREVVRHPGGCCVAALDHDQNLIFVKQFRYPYQTQTIELPAGKLDIDGESPQQAVKRELKEETGYIAKQWISLGTLFPSPGYCDEVLYLYAATQLEKVGDQQPDEGEFLDAFKLPLQQAVEQVLQGDIRDAKTVAGILKVKILLDEGRLTV